MTATAWTARAVALLLATGAHAQTSPGPQPVPMPPPIPSPRDVPFEGTIQLSVDARDTERRIMRIHETIPVAAGAETILLFPEWVPGAHNGPTRCR